MTKHDTSTGLQCGLQCECKSRNRASLTAVFIAMIAGLVTTGCGATTQGEETTCGDFLDMSSDDKTAVITLMLQDEGTDDPSNGQITLTKTSAELYCNTAGSDSDPIENING